MGEGLAISQMYATFPSAGDWFYLCTLLTIVRGPQSFVHLRTVDGILHETYRQACLAMGVLEDDGEWRLCLQEASIMQTGYTLRSLFSTILLHNNPSRPELLWTEFRQFICDDLDYQLQRPPHNIAAPTNDQIYDYGLFLIRERLAWAGQRMETIAPGMPQVEGHWVDPNANPLIERQRAPNPNELRDQVERDFPLLNNEQMMAYTVIRAAYQSGEGGTFFIHGPGGCGKTFLYNVVTRTARSEGKIVLCVASSGIASMLLLLGATAHSTFKIPIPLMDDGACRVEKQGFVADLMRETTLIIWDEAGMMHRNGPEAVDRMLRDIRDDDRPFGGVTTVFGGDFQQVLPVIPKGSREQIVRACLHKSPLWHNTRIFFLTKNMQLENNNDPATLNFANWLLDVGHGRLQGDSTSIRLPNHMKAGGDGKLPDLIDAIYPNINQPQAGPHPDTYFLDRVILSPRNDDVHHINSKVIDKFPGQEKVYHSADRVLPEDGVDDPVHNLPLEYLNSLNASGLPISHLTLKVGAPLLILRNLSVQDGVCNGTRAVILELNNRVIKARILGGSHAGDIILIPRLNLTPSETGMLVLKFQIPF